jgi:hypothetical protein
MGNITNPLSRDGQVNMKSKKSQITIFMIVGIIILALFILLYFTLTSVLKERKDTETSIKNTLASAAVNQYITSCVEDALQDGLVLLGEQGGYLYIDQGSVIPRVATISAGNTTYLIRPMPMSAPWYPCKNPNDPPGPGFCNFSNNVTAFPDLFSMAYGIKNLPSLERNVPSSIKNQLEKYISNHTKNCTKSYLSSLPEFSAYSIIDEDIQVDVIFGENDVSAIASYPITININNNQISERKEYGARIKNRFKKIYYAVNEIIEKDNQYLDFSIVETVNSAYFMGFPLKFRELFDATITKEPLASNIYDDLVAIKDPFSKIRGIDYVFKFAIQNRIPALDYIKSASDNAKAADPDEDTIMYSISGDGVSIDQYTGQITGSASGTFTVHASDGQLEDYQEVEI